MTEPTEYGRVDVYPFTLQPVGKAVVHKGKPAEVRFHGVPDVSICVVQFAASVPVVLDPPLLGKLLPSSRIVEVVAKFDGRMTGRSRPLTLTLAGYIDGGPGIETLVAIHSLEAIQHTLAEILRRLEARR